MAQITITINSREYSIECEDGQEARILQLANVLDEKAKMFSGAMGQINESMLLAMVGLVLADEISELKKGILPEKSNSDNVNFERIAEIDKSLSIQIKSLENSLKGLANKIDLM